MRQFEAQLRAAALSGEASQADQIRIMQAWYAKQVNLENGLQIVDGVSETIMYQLMAGKTPPRRIHVARMAVMNAISDHVANTFPLTVREADDYFYSMNAIFGEAVRPVDIIAGLDQRAIEARTGNLLTELAGTTERYIGEALVWLTAIQDATATMPVAARV